MIIQKFYHAVHKLYTILYIYWRRRVCSASQGVVSVNLDNDFTNHILVYKNHAFDYGMSWTTVFIFTGNYGVWNIRYLIFN